MKGEEIPLVARIIAIAESYDRMIHDTHNRPGMSKEQALRIISKEESGAQFDPALVDPIYPTHVPIITVVPGTTLMSGAKLIFLLRKITLKYSSNITIVLI